MLIFWAIFYILIGFVLLIKGADFLVDGSSAVAKKFNVSDIVIGLTIVSMGTSAPELVINISSVLEGKTGFVYGNVIGSNLFNTLCIVGIAGMVYPLKVLKSTARIELPISLLIVVVVFILSNDSMFWGDKGLAQNSQGVLSRFDGLILISLFIAFFLYVFRNIKSEPQVGEIVKTMANWKAILFIAGGIVGLIIGGNYVLDGATTIAKSFGLSERIIGLTVLAAGTSLPELATSVVAAMKKNSDIAVGNVIGSNIFNILGILAISAIVKDVPYDTATNFDLYTLMIGHLLLMLMLFIGTRYKNGFYTVDKWQAFILAAFFVSYTTFLIIQSQNA
jgi:cation:H+ antiporter